MKQKVILQHIFEMANEQPNKISIFEKSFKITYKQYWDSIVAYAHYIERKGVKKGDHIAIIAEQKIRFLVAVSAIHLIGATIIPLEKNLPDTRIAELLEKLEIKWLIATKEISITEVHRLSIEKADKQINCAKNQFLLDFKLPQENDIADILFTTGTTGMPKGIVMTHLANKAIAENVIDSVCLEEDDIELIPTPINHSLGLRRYYGAMLRGSTLGISDGVIYADDFFCMLETYHVTAITLVPTMLSLLLKFSSDRLAQYNQKLHFIQLGSAPIPKGDREKLKELLPDVRLYNTYGATESGCTCIIDFNSINDKMFCIGRPTINTKISFVDDNGQPMKITSPNQVGYMVFDGPMNMKCYWKEPELTKTVLKNGKIYSNDVGYCDEDGLIYLLGRKDDVINSGGNKIAPAEIEETLLKYEKIEECACVPIKDKIAGQLPKLYVVMKAGATYNPAEILSYLYERLEFFKVPKAIEQIEKLPRAYNGKLLRKELIQGENQNGKQTKSNYSNN